MVFGFVQSNVSNDDSAAWPVANPVVTCASVSDAGFPSNFVADPFLFIQVITISCHPFVQSYIWCFGFYEIVLVLPLCCFLFLLYFFGRQNPPNFFIHTVFFAKSVCLDSTTNPQL